LLIAYFFASLLSRVEKILPDKTSEQLFKIMQLMSSALLSLTHGGNDAQKTMGIISILLFSASWLGDTFYVPMWVVLSCHLVISLGTLAGGWRIVYVMGNKITELNPMRGSAAETGAAVMIYAATECGVPVSTTHTVTGAVAGVGLLKGYLGVNMHTLRRIFCSWLLTIPLSGAMASVVMLIIR
jgi:PiT family inorganic phosphate transporter